MTDGVVLRREWLVTAIAEVLRAAGAPPAGASVVADSLVEADLRGVPSHGTMLVPMYVDRLLAGSVSGREQAETVVDTGAIAVLDGGHALGQLTGDQAMALAVGKAKAYGIGAVVVRHAFHFGGAFRYAQAAAREGCIGIAMANTRPLMPAPGGGRPVVGNNPIAVAVPVAGAEPVTLDMALSEAALGKIRLAAQDGRPIPASWATDAHGGPTTDPAAALAGMLLPMAGPKGYGLALMVDLLTGVLGGGGFGGHVRPLYADVERPNDCAHLFLALDISMFGDSGEFASRADDLVSQIRAAPTAPGVERVYLPGEIEATRASAGRTSGVPISRAVLQSLRDKAIELGVELTEPLGEGKA